MLGKVLVPVLLAVLVFFPSGSIRNIAPLDSDRPLTYSSWVTSAPTIDGKFQTGEYGDGDPPIIFSVPPYDDSYVNASVYFVNDAQRLYVMVDVTGDLTDNPLDEALLVFGFTPGGGFTSSAVVAFRGVAGFTCFGNAPGPNCVIPDQSKAVIGYGPSPNSAEAHKMYEVSIPVNALHKVGQQAIISSPKADVFTAWEGTDRGGGHGGGKGGSLGYDQATGRDNVWPQALIMNNVETWGILVLASSVPEFSEAFAVVMVVAFMIPVCLLRLGRENEPIAETL